MLTVLQKAAKVLKATLDKLGDKLLDEPSFPTPMGFGEDMAPIDHDFKRRRKQVMFFFTTYAIEEV